MKVSAVFLLIFSAISLSLHSQVGNVVKNVTLLNAFDEKTPLPYIGKEVFLIFDMDPDRQHIVDPLTESLTNGELSSGNFGVITVLNCKDTWMPYFAIRTGVKGELKKYPDSVILLDKSNTLPKAWALGDCDNAAAILVIGKDSRVKFSRIVRSEDECSKVIGEIHSAINKEIR
ncbi:MAG: YtfJ family protein [Bacteroidales bacterium]